MSTVKQKSGPVKGREKKIVQIDEGEIRSHLSEVVRRTVEEMMNAMLAMG
ncbi:MAG: hypothetical protein P8018_08310 [Acidobacteriota bacterium]|jgi:hypothetical protein